MRSCIVTCSFAVSFTAAIAISVFASPVDWKLLPLVPAGSQIVAGFANLPDAKGRLLMATHNNGLDLDDWLALTGVDAQRKIDEVIEAAASPTVAELSEHLLLVSGRLNRERIFSSAEQNGAEKTRYLGETVLLIKPFERENGDMLDTRWMVILNDQIGIFGTPYMVQQALRRHDIHAVVDPELMERVAHFRSDVTSWNVLAASPRALRAASIMQPRSPMATLMADTDLLMVGTHFGSRIRIDLNLLAKGDKGAAFLTQKAATFSDGFAQFSADHGAPTRPAQARLENVVVEQNRILASIKMTKKEFDAWKGGEINRNQALLSKRAFLDR